jgi:hypothetical protein
MGRSRCITGAASRVSVRVEAKAILCDPDVAATRYRPRSRGHAWLRPA